jgi:hypothetical protein
MHPWEWLLDNLDGNESQYVLLGEERLPMMIDWDRAFHRGGADLGLSRFSQHRPMLPNLRNFLYADFVEHRVDLDLTVLLEEARRISRLPDAPLKALFQRYADAMLPAEERRNFVRCFMRRKKSVERAFKRFAGALARERRLQGTLDLPPESRIVLWSHRVWNRITRMLDAAWRGPIGKVSRALLRKIRARRTVSANAD